LAGRKTGRPRRTPEVVADRAQPALADFEIHAVHADVTAEHLAHVVRDIPAIDVGDGVVFDLHTISVQEIREQADCAGLRVRVAVRSDRGRARLLEMYPPETRSCCRPGR